MPPPSAATRNTTGGCLPAGNRSRHVQYSWQSVGSDRLSAEALTSWLSFQKLNAAAHASASRSTCTPQTSDANTARLPKNTRFAAAMNKMATGPSQCPVTIGAKTNSANSVNDTASEISAIRAAGARRAARIENSSTAGSGDSLKNV